MVPTAHLKLPHVFYLIGKRWQSLKMLWYLHVVHVVLNDAMNESDYKIPTSGQANQFRMGERLQLDRTRIAVWRIKSLA